MAAIHSHVTVPPYSSFPEPVGLSIKLSMLHWKLVFYNDGPVMTLVYFKARSSRPLGEAVKLLMRGKLFCLKICTSPCPWYNVFEIDWHIIQISGERIQNNWCSGLRKHTSDLDPVCTIRVIQTLQALIKLMQLFPFYSSKNSNISADYSYTCIPGLGSIG